MAVYFVYRCYYGSPSEKHVRRFEYDTVLNWAKAVWKLHATRAEAKRYAEHLFGDLDRADAFCGLFHNEGEYSMTTRPRTMADVKQWFGALDCDAEAHGPHHLQVLVEWDDNQRAVYVFDDHYRAKKPGKADFLLLDGWELPGGEIDAPAPKPTRTRERTRGGRSGHPTGLSVASGSGGGEGALYLVGLLCDCKYHLEDLDKPEHIVGLRVPDLARYVLTHPDPDDLAFPLGKVRAGLLAVLNEPRREDAGFLTAIRDQPGELVNWGAYADWLCDRDRPPAGLHLLERALNTEDCAFVDQHRKPKLDLVKVTPHMAQACKHENGRADEPDDELTVNDTFAQLIFFDDRWAAAHPDLATGVLTFAARWDVLT